MSDKSGRSDLSSFLTYFDNFDGNRHKAGATRSPTTGRIVRRDSNGEEAPSSLPSSSSLPQSPLLRVSLMILWLYQLPLKESLQVFTLDSLTSSTVSQGQVLLQYLATWSSRSIFLRSATFTSLESYPKEKRNVCGKTSCVLHGEKLTPILLLVLVRFFYWNSKQLVALHSALIQAHEDTDIRSRSVIYRPVGSTRQLVTKLSPPNVTVIQGHRYSPDPRRTDTFSCQESTS